MAQAHRTVLKYRSNNFANCELHGRSRRKSSLYCVKLSIDVDSVNKKCKVSGIVGDYSSDHAGFPETDEVYNDYCRHSAAW